MYSYVTSSVNKWLSFHLWLSQFEKWLLYFLLQSAWLEAHWDHSVICRLHWGQSPSLSLHVCPQCSTAVLGWCNSWRHLLLDNNRTNIKWLLNLEGCHWNNWVINHIDFKSMWLMTVFTFIKRHTHVHISVTSLEPESPFLSSAVTAAN